MLGNASLNGFHDVDPEKDAAHTSATTSHGGNNELDDGLPGASRFDSMTKRLAVWGVESRGILPVPPSKRTDPQFSKVFFIWLSANLNILSFSAGTIGPLIYELSLRDTCLVIVGFNLIGCLLPAYFSTFGPKLGLRQMCQARYSFGYYGAIVPALLNLASMMGFLILNCILGGETLSSASVSSAESGGGISWDAGIVIISIISLFISFCGYRVLNWYERYAWIPILIVFIIALGVSGRHLNGASDLPPASARQILSFGATIAGFVISYSPLASDFTSYMREDVASWKVFLSVYSGFFLPIALIQILGASFAASLPNNPTWQAAYHAQSLSGLLHAILQPAGSHFSRFLLVITAFSVTANVAPTLYSCSLSLQVCLPFEWVLRIPRYALSTVVTAILIPLAIVGSTHFYDALVNFLGIIGYWSACFGGVVFIEHLLFRRGQFRNYNIPHWDQPRLLPPGAAALLSCVGAIAVIVPFMDQVWWVGPAATRTGDIGFEVGFVVAALFYAFARTVEKKLLR